MGSSCTLQIIIEAINEIKEDVHGTKWGICTHLKIDGNKKLLRIRQQVWIIFKEDRGADGRKPPV